MNISGIYIKALPANLSAVQQRLKNITGIEIHMATDEGKLIATVESDDAGAMADTVINIEQVEGVLSATLVYHHDDSNSLAGEAR